jgi:pimeloyl-ACP methyl ester carboxylesterase
MILDSPAFPDRKLHHNYLRRVMAPYDMLFKYCGDEDGCSDPRESRQLQRAFWNLYHELNRSPLRVVVKNPYTGRRLPVVLNGERFLGAVSEGVYGSEIFRQLKHILHDLEDGDTRSLYPYLKSYLVFLLDQTYGDLSAEAHYCHETKPFTDFDLIRRLSDELPAGYIRATAKLSIDWPDNCAQMAVTAGAPDLAQALETDTPTLFLQGTLDTITPLSDVEARRESFSNGALLTFDLSHDVLGSSTCAEALVADFVRTGVMQDKAVACD